MERQILVPLDGSPAAEQVLPHALAFASANASAIRLVQAVPPSADGRDGANDAATAAQRYLERLALQLSLAGVPAQATVLVGAPAEEILRLIGAEAGIEQIAIASHGRGRMSRMLFGSVAQQVLADARIPLLMVRMNPTHGVASSFIKQQPIARPPSYKSILVPLDGSPQADAAVAHAERIARATGAAVVLASVTEPAPQQQRALAGGMDAAQRPALAPDEEAARHLEAVADRLQRSGVRARTHLAAGDPVRILSAAAMLEHADLLVMTTHAYVGMKQLWLGSVALDLSAATLLPILMIRIAAAQELAS
ncbi:MAG TPA: universal stress protein [Herpetosiphonaceae bacterium]